MYFCTEHKNIKTMKKHLLLILLAVVAVSLHAQNVSMNFIPFHYTGYDSYQFDCKIMQQRDGNLTCNVLAGIPSGDNHTPPTYLGNTFYKVSPFDLQFTDSLFVPVAESVPYFYTLHKDPRGNGNLRVNIEPDDNGGTALRIAHFPDDNLVIHPEEDLVVHLHDDAAFDYIDSYVIDEHGDLIVEYYTGGPGSGFVCHIARFGLDGTLKHSTTLPSTFNSLPALEDFDPLARQYFQWKESEDNNLLLYVVDSLFQVENYYAVSNLLEELDYEVFYEEEPYNIHVMETFSFVARRDVSVIIDGGDLLVAAPYVRDSGMVFDYREEGIAVARYELRTMQRKALVHFNDWPGPYTDVQNYCFQKSHEGNLYLVYREPNEQQMPWMTAVKMDRDLNVIWKRYCYKPGEIDASNLWSTYSGLLDDAEGNETGVYVAGYSYRLADDKGGLFFFFLDDEELTAVGESGIVVRPYTYYPNPTRDVLHLQFSPDVTPKQIELYDLQGRLVRVQRNGLETLEMNGLAAGTYTMRVTLENGQVFSDKVVKE